VTTRVLTGARKRPGSLDPDTPYGVSVGEPEGEGIPVSGHVSQPRCPTCGRPLRQPHRNRFLRRRLSGPGLGPVEADIIERAWARLKRGVLR
jgi:hypothetical protein